MKNEEEKEIRYADLFGGVGGFRLGIEQAEICIGIGGDKERNGEPETSIKSLQKCNESSSSERDTTSINRRQKKFNCVFYCDNDKYAVQTYNKNFKENYEPTDIRTIKTSEIPNFDMLCAGFPCQAFSITGKRRGFEDTRGTLFFEIARIVKAKRPKIIFLENVKGLLNHEQGQTFSIILNTLWELGYDVQWMVLNSKFFGVPQNRERVFIIGSIRGTGIPEILPFKTSNEEVNYKCKQLEETKGNYQGARVFSAEGISRTIASQGGGQGAKTGLYMTDVSKKIKQRLEEPNQEEIRQYLIKWRHNSKMTIKQIEEHFGNQAGHHWFEKKGSVPSVDDWIKLKKLLCFDNTYDKLMTSFRWTTEWELMQKHKNRHSAKGNGFGFQIKNSNEEAGTLTATEKGIDYNLINNKMAIRRLTPIECERLLGFPDNWTEKGFNGEGEEVLVSDPQRYKMMGNAVTTNVITAIAQKLIKVT